MVVHIWFLLCTMSFSLFSFSRLRFSTSWYRGYGILSGLRPFPPRLLIIWSSNFLFFFPSSDDETRHSDGGIHSSYLIVCKLYLPNSCTSLIVCLKSTPSFSIFFFLSSSLAFFAFVTWPWERRRRRRRRKLKMRKKEELVFEGVYIDLTVVSSSSRLPSFVFLRLLALSRLHAGSWNTITSGSRRLVEEHVAIFSTALKVRSSSSSCLVLWCYHESCCAACDGSQRHDHRWGQQRSAPIRGQKPLVVITVLLNHCVCVYAKGAWNQTSVINCLWITNSNLY